MKKLAYTFWNIRGVHRIGGLFDIRTQISLGQRSDGGILGVYGCGLDESHRLYPDASLYGTARHHKLAPSLPWSPVPVEDWKDDHPLGDLFDLSVPDGVEFVSADERVHVASVLVRHRQTRIVHVDDTFNVIAAPGVLRDVFPVSSLRMHPMLGRALKKEAGSANAYAAWATALAAGWADTRIVCAAHSAVRSMPTDGFSKEVAEALGKVSGTLDRHRARYG